MTPEFQKAISSRIESDILPMIEELNITINKSELDGYEKAQLMRRIIHLVERVKELCWEGAIEVTEELEADIIRKLRRQHLI